jgi:short-subunit dehydrogenase
MITGATGGLGKAFAVECAARGENLYLTDLREEPLTQLATALRRAYRIDARSRACDLTDERQRSELFAVLAQEGANFGKLINVAGGDAEGLFAEQSRERIRMILRLNVEAAVEMTHALLALRDRSRTFRVINVASLAAFCPMPYKATYAASKRFMLDLSLALREERREQDVTVTALCPAGMPTTPECIAAIEAQGLMGYLTTVNTGAVASLALDASERGQAVIVPGALNRALRWASALAPAGWAGHLIGRRWAAAHRKRKPPIATQATAAAYH